jgi:hypothetical protein
MRESIAHAVIVMEEHGVWQHYNGNAMLVPEKS